MPNRLKLSAVLFGVLWTGWMICWADDRGLMHLLILSISGVFTSSAWYFAMKWFANRHQQPGVS